MSDVSQEETLSGEKWGQICLATLSLDIFLLEDEQAAITSGRPEEQTGRA
jgi:hypothetical protein